MREGGVQASFDNGSPLRIRLAMLASRLLPSLRSLVQPSVERPIAFHLTIFSLALILPILIVAGVLVRSYTVSERSRIEQDILRIAHEARSTTDRKIAGLIATTEVLSLSRYLQEGDLASFDLQAREVAALLGINVVLRDMNGNQVVNTRLPPGAPLPRNVDIRSDMAVLATGKPVVSDLFLGAVVQRPLFMINVPVTREKQIVYFLNLSVDPEIVRDLVSEIRMREGTVVSVLDRSGKIVARSADHETTAGAALDSSVLQELGTGEGILRDQHVGQGGGAYLVAFSRSDASGWTFLAMLPSETASAPLTKSLAGLATFGAGLLLIGVALAIVFARRISAPVETLALQARRLGRGEAVLSPKTSLREVNVLSSALFDAALKRQQVETAIRESEARLQLAQVAGGVGTWEWNVITGVGTCSESYCRLYGLDPRSGGHKSSDEWLAQVHPDDRAHVLRVRDSALLNGTLDNEYRIVRPDGSVRRIVDRGIGFHDASGKLTRFLGANVDVTAARAAEDRLRELHSELLHASRLSGMGQMAAALAHELSQPLGAAANYINAARMSMQSGGEQAIARAIGRLESATAQTSRAGAILRRMRDFVSLGETDKRMCKVRQIVEDAVALALVGVRDPALRTRLAFHPSDRDPAILVDSVQIQQVIFNLVRNALEATEGQHPREITVVTRFHAAASIEIAVSDSGPGFSGDPEALFKPFSSTKSQGMGLGLSICRTIIEAHGGRLRAQHGPGGGAVFTFSIPVSTQEGRLT